VGGGYALVMAKQAPRAAVRASLGAAVQMRVGRGSEPGVDLTHRCLR
jgi:hypothetical protein